MRGLSSTSIPFATHSWSVMTGCDETLPCARNCWAKRDAWRMAHNPNEEIARRFRGLVEEDPCDPPPEQPAACYRPGMKNLPCEGGGCRFRRWTGQVHEFPEFLDAPGRLRQPAVIFVAPHGDLGLASAGLIFRLFLEMESWSRSEYLVVTKRWPMIARAIALSSDPLYWKRLGNVTVCVSCSTQAEFDERVGAICDPASPAFWAGRKAAFLEPQLERIGMQTGMWDWAQRLDWIVQGCESLPGRKVGRPFEVAWAREVRDWCADARVSYWLKQGAGWGLDGEDEQGTVASFRVLDAPALDGVRYRAAPERIAAILKARGKVCEVARAARA